jgi:hypothetical protein
MGPKTSAESAFEETRIPTKIGVDPNWVTIIGNKGKTILYPKTSTRILRIIVNIALP